MRIEDKAGGEHTDHVSVLDAVVGLRPIGTKDRGNGSTTIIVEPTILFENTPGAGERTLRAGAAELEEAARMEGKKIEIVLRRQPGSKRIHGTPIWNATWEPQTPEPNWVRAENLSID